MDTVRSIFLLIVLLILIVSFCRLIYMLATAKDNKPKGYWDYHS